VQSLSIVIPVLNDAPALQHLLGSLTNHLAGGVCGSVEIIVVDGGSSDDGCALALRYGCVVMHTPASRGRQLQEGFARSKGEWVWFLHADSRLDSKVVAWLAQLQRPAWGRFDVRFVTARPMLALVAKMMNWRSRYTGICTGDQGIFVHRSLLTSIGGVPQQSLMEDIELSKRLKRQGLPLCPSLSLTTSPRRWERRGVVGTIVSMWWFRLRYWLGADPQQLAREYYS
jgi:rSAM/selenodomain-associated transferase 2